MQIMFKNDKEGKIGVIPENLDDLWHLEKIIRPGDIVSAKTYRRFTTKDAKERLEKKPVYITLGVEDVKFEEFADRLKIKGKIIDAKPSDFINIGAYHSIDVTIGEKITIQKEKWHKFELDRLEKAKKAAEQPKLCIVAIDDEIAAISSVNQRGISKSIIIESGRSGKEYVQNFKETEYLQEIVSNIESIGADNLLIAGPGFEKDHLKEYIRTHAPKLAKRIVFEKCSIGGPAGIHEIIERGLLKKISEDIIENRRTEIFQEIFQNIIKEKNATYGLAEVEKAAKLGAVEAILITDRLFRENREKIEDILDYVDANKGEIHIIPEKSTVGSKLRGLGGIVALLRYKISET